MPETQLKVTTTVKAPAGVVFDLLASPWRHHETDASGTVGDDETGEPITKAGQVFRMNMSITGEDGTTRHYQTDNHVTKFKPNRKIAWKVAEADGKPLGWFWRYDLSPKGKRDQKTLVTLTYDWGDVERRDAERIGLPKFDEAALRTSLELLAAAVEE